METKSLSFGETVFAFMMGYFIIKNFGLIFSVCLFPIGLALAAVQTEPLISFSALGIAFLYWFFKQK